MSNPSVGDLLRARRATCSVQLTVRGSVDAGLRPRSLAPNALPLPPGPAGHVVRPSKRSDPGIAVLHGLSDDTFLSTSHRLAKRAARVFNQTRTYVWTLRVGICG